MTRTLLPLLVAACGWGNLPDQDYAYREALWDAGEVHPTTDGVFVPLAYPGPLLRINTKGPEALIERVDLKEALATRVVPLPDQTGAITFLTTLSCDAERDGSGKKVKVFEDCPEDDREETYEVALLRNGKEVARAPEREPIGTLIFSPDDRFAVGLTRADAGQGVYRLDAVSVFDLDRGELNSVSVGFLASSVAFVPGPAGETAQVVVVSPTEAALVDLSGSPPRRVATFPLSLDPDSSLPPLATEITPDGRYALTATATSSDLYALDLQEFSINLVELPGVPADMVVHGPSDRTVVASAQARSLALIDHDLFDAVEIPVEEGVSQLIATEAGVIGWSDRSRDVYRVELPGGELTEYRLPDQPNEVLVAPGERWALATGRDGALQLLDLADDEVYPYALEGAPLAIAFTEDAQGTWALILQSGVDYLFLLELDTGAAREVALDEPPATIASLPDGRFVISHRSGSGLLSFYDPSEDSVVLAAGFALEGLLEETPFIPAKKEK
jgi:hypothetical protein